MRIRAVLREAWRNVATGTARARTLALGAALSVCLLCGADMLATRQLLDRADDFVRSGAAVTIISATGRIDGARCDRLAELGAVTASGAIRSTADPLAPVVLRSAPIPVNEVSFGFTDLVRGSARGAGILVGPEVVEALGLALPGVLSTTAGSVRVGGEFAYPEDGRRPGLSYAALAAASADQPFDECWVESRSGRELTSALFTTVLLLGGGEDPPTTAQLNSTRGTSFDGPALYAERITRVAGPLSAVFGIVLGFAGVRARRLSFASALHSGASRSDLRRIVTAETFGWVLLSAALAVPVIVVVGFVLDGPGLASLAGGLLAALSLWLSGFVGAWMGLATIRERSLFRYFKAR